MNKKARPGLITVLGTAFFAYLLVFAAYWVSLFSPLLGMLVNSFEKGKEKEVLIAFQLICYYVLPLVFYIFLQEAGERKLYTVLPHGRKKVGFFSLLAEAVGSSDFWSNSAPLVFFLILGAPNGLLSYMALPFFRGNIVLDFVNRVLLYGIPEIALLWLCEGFLRQDWQRQWRFCGFGLAEDGLADIPPTSRKRLTLHIVIVFAALVILPALVAYYQVVKIGVQLGRR